MWRCVKLCRLIGSHNFWQGSVGCSGPAFAFKAMPTTVKESNKKPEPQSPPMAALSKKAKNQDLTIVVLIYAMSAMLVEWVPNTGGQYDPMSRFKEHASQMTIQECTEMPSDLIVGWRTSPWMRRWIRFARHWPNDSLWEGPHAHNPVPNGKLGLIFVWLNSWLLLQVSCFNRGWSASRAIGRRSAMKWMWTASGKLSFMQIKCEDLALKGLLLSYFQLAHWQHNHIWWATYIGKLSTWTIPNSKSCQG